MPTPAESRTTQSRRAGLVLALLCIAAAAPAQSLRLDDVFTTQTLPALSLTLADFQANPASAAEYRAAVEQLLGEARFDEALAATELLTAWHEPGSPDYGEVLYLRAACYQGLRQPASILRLADVYLKTYGFTAPRSGWFLLEMARTAEAERRPRTAATLWERLLRTEHPIAPTDGIAGARVLLMAGRPAEARAVLRRAFVEGSSQLAPELLRQREALWLDTLLYADDRTEPIPPARPATAPAAATYNLRRALLIELRGDIAAATEALTALRDGQFGPLASPERVLVEERLRAARRSAWPPKPLENQRR
jgi:hypothetical protein